MDYAIVLTMDHEKAAMVKEIIKNTALNAGAAAARASRRAIPFQPSFR